MNHVLALALILVCVTPARANGDTGPLLAYVFLGMYVHVLPALVVIAVGALRWLLGRGTRSLKFGVAWMAWTFVTLGLAWGLEWIHWGGHAGTAWAVETAALLLSILLGPVVAWRFSRSTAVPPTAAVLPPS
jgi:hypothetical protein